MRRAACRWKHMIWRSVALSPRALNRLLGWGWPVNCSGTGLVRQADRGGSDPVRSRWRVWISTWLGDATPGGDGGQRSLVTAPSRPSGHPFYGASIAALTVGFVSASRFIGLLLVTSLRRRRLVPR